MQPRLLVLAIITSLGLTAIGVTQEAATAPPAKGRGKTSKNGEPAPPHPGLFNRIFHTMHLSHSKADEEAQAKAKALPNWKHVVLTMRVEPQPLNLSDAHVMKVTLRLENKSKKFVQMEYPTTQRIEVLVKTPEGKLVEHWSEDQSFANEAGMVSINPGERVEYSADVSTRDLKPGQPVIVEGFFPNYETLRASSTITPGK